MSNEARPSTTSVGSIAQSSSEQILQPVYGAVMGEDGAVEDHEGTDDDAGNTIGEDGDDDETGYVRSPTCIYMTDRFVS